MTYKECKFTDIKVVLVTLSKLKFKHNFPNFPNHNTILNFVYTIMFSLRRACELSLSYYKNKRHIRVLYDGFKLSSGCIKDTKPEGLSALM